MMKRLAPLLAMVGSIAACAASSPSNPPNNNPAATNSSATNSPASTTGASPASSSNGTSNVSNTNSAATSTATTQPTPPVASASAGATTLSEYVASKPNATGGGGEISVRVLESQNVDGFEVGKALQYAQFNWNKCYESFFKKKPHTKAKTVLALTIDASGKLKTSSTKEDETKDTAIIKCIETSLKNINWPKPTTAPGTASVELFVTGK